MGAHRDNQGIWRYRKRVILPDGTGTRIKGTPAINTKLEAERAERAHVERVLRRHLIVRAVIIALEQRNDLCLPQIEQVTGSSENLPMGRTLRFLPVDP